MSASYDRVAPIYDLLGALYSLGGIGRSKRAHLGWVREGQSVLYVGAGTGEECAEAAARGAKVTVCDSSPRMLERAERRLLARGLSASCQLCDARQLDGHYDWVVAPYFLNVFDRKAVAGMLVTLTDRLKPGGHLVAVDFQRPTGSLPFRLLQRLYYLLPQLLFLLLTKNPWHELYDYSKIAQTAAPELDVKERIPTRVMGLALLESIRFEKRAPDRDTIE